MSNLPDILGEVLDPGSCLWQPEDVEGTPTEMPAPNNALAVPPSFSPTPSPSAGDAVSYDNWAQLGSDTDGSSGENDDGDELGYSVSVSKAGDLLVVGALGCLFDKGWPKFTGMMNLPMHGNNKVKL